MKYRLIALDLDHTLLREDGSVGERTRRAILAAQSKGAFVILNSGRMLGATVPVARDLGIIAPIVCAGGAAIYGSDLTPLKTENIDPGTACAVVALAAEHGISSQVYIGSEVWYQQDSDAIEAYKKQFGFKTRLVPDLMHKDGIVTQKVLMLKDVESIDAVAPIARSMFPDLNIAKSRPNFLEFTKKGVTKATGLAFLGEHLGIDKSEMIAVGDNEIDESMIGYAGLGCAVKNALDSTKAIASYISGSNDEDGVAEIIEKFILGE